MRTYWLLGYDETTASPRELVKEVNQEIDDIVLDNGNFSPHELNTDAVDQSSTYAILVTGHEKPLAGATSIKK